MSDVISRHLTSEIPPIGAIGLAAEENILSGIGLETKAVLLSAMEPDCSYSQADLHRIFLTARYGREGYEANAWQGVSDGGSEPFTSRPLPRQYCADSLGPNDLVEVALPPEPFAAKITPLGQGLGRAYAGHLMDYSLRYPGYTLFDILGRPSASSRRRSPGLRMAIYRALFATGGEITLKDLSDASGINNTRVTLTQVEKLAFSGIVTYRDIRRDGEPRTSAYARQITQLGEEIVRGYRETSRVALSPTARQPIVDFVSIINALHIQEPSVVAKGKGLATSIVGNPDLVGYLFESAEGASRTVRGLPREQREEQIYEYVKGSDVPASSAAVAKALGVGRRYVLGLMAAMADKGTLRMVEGGDSSSSLYMAISDTKTPLYGNGSLGHSKTVDLEPAYAADEESRTVGVPSGVDLSSGEKVIFMDATGSIKTLGPIARAATSLEPTRDSEKPALKHRLIFQQPGSEPAKNPLHAQIGGDV